MSSKRDLIRMSAADRRRGIAMQARMEREGRLASNSFDAERAAPKTWLIWCKGARPTAQDVVIMCELYGIGDGYGAGQGMLNGMCPCCGETFLVRENNKEMTLGTVEFGKAPAWLRDAYLGHHIRDLGRNEFWRPDASTKIPVVSSPERWMCDYCKRWSVRVSEGVAVDDHRGIGRIYATPGMLVGGGTAPPATSPLEV